jgi:SEC-C motif domain protein
VAWVDTTALQRPCPGGLPATYDACCGRLHRGAAEARTAEELMRSRYAAYALGHTDHLFRTWHPRTRPGDLLGAPEEGRPHWRRLEVLDTLRCGAADETGEVEFRAHYRADGHDGVLHERSRFVRRAGRWVYLDGDVA